MKMRRVDEIAQRDKSNLRLFFEEELAFLATVTSSFIFSSSNSKSSQADLHFRSRAFF